MINKFSSFFRQSSFRANQIFTRRASTLAFGVATTGVFLYCGQTAYAKDGNRVVFAWGSGQYGQLGYGGERDVSSPKQITELDNEDVVFISAGGQQSAALTSDGRVYTWGRSQDRRLGHGVSDGNNETHPRLVEELIDEKVVCVDAGFLHMACVTENGDVWTWGKNSSKQLGHKNSDFPMKVELESDLKIVTVACGRNHTLALSDQGEVYAWGGTKTGAQGTGKRGSEPKPTLVHSVADSNIVQIASGEDFSLFLTEEGHMYSCGASDFGQSGHGRSNRYIISPTLLRGMKKHKIVRIACGQYHAVCVSDKGDVFSWGFNKDGQLGQGDNFHRHTPSQVFFSDIVEGKATDVACGGGHSGVVFNNGESVYIFGRGRCGQIGRGTEIESMAAYRPTPVEVKFFRNNDYRIEQVCLGSDHSLLCTQPV